MSAEVIQHPASSRIELAARSTRLPVRREKRPKTDRLPCDRVRLALQAGWELDAIAAALLAGGTAVDEHQQRLLDRCMHARIAALASVVMSVCGDDTGRETREMHRVVHGMTPTSG